MTDKEKFLDKAWTYLSRMGVPIPNFIKKLIDRLKTNVDESGDLS